MDLENVVLNAPHDAVSPPARVEVEAGRHTMTAAEHEARSRRGQRVQLVCTGEHIEEWTADRDVRIEGGWRNRIGVRPNREAEQRIGNPRGNGLGEYQPVLESRPTDAANARTRQRRADRPRKSRAE